MTDEEKNKLIEELAGELECWFDDNLIERCAKDLVERGWVKKVVNVP